jgi:hypothetical protein
VVDDPQPCHRVAHRVLNILVAEVSLQGSGIVSCVGQDADPRPLADDPARARRILALALDGLAFFERGTQRKARRRPAARR